MAKKTNIQELARRYTTAVFELAKSQNKLDKLSEELGQVNAAIKADESIRKMFGSPVLTSQKQVEIVRGLASKLGLDPLTTNFLLVVAKNRRVKNLSEINDAFRAQINEELGFVNAQVISAEKLDESELKDLEAGIAKKTGKKVKIEESVDASIMGGLIVRIGSKMIDYSVKSRLNSLRNKLKSA